MVRARYPRSTGPLPPPLPPATRTVGQLVAETIKFYGHRWRAALLIGLPAAILSTVAAGFDRSQTLEIVPFAGALAASASFVGACAVVTGSSVRSRSSLTAFVVGIVVWIPFPFLAVLFVLPGLAWLAFVGMAVPAALVERRGVSAALRRGIELGRADYAHALGGLATLTVLVFLTQIAASLLLQNYADNSERVAAFLAGLVFSPVLFFGGALLYADQAARVGTTRLKRAPAGVAARDATE